MEKEKTLITADELRLHAAEIVKGYRNEHTRRAYDREARRFVAWYASGKRSCFDSQMVSDYGNHLLSEANSSTRINHGSLFLAAMAKRLANSGIIDGGTVYLATSIARLPQEKIERLPLSDEVIRQLIGAPDAETMTGFRDRAVLCVLFGCGLDRSECATLAVEQIQDGQFVKVAGRRGKFRNVSIPAWANEALLGWLEISGINSGPLFPSLALQRSAYADRPMSPQAIYDIVRKYATIIGAQIRPNDLRRTHLILKEKDADDLRQTIAKLNREIDSLRRALKHKSNLTPDRLRGAVMEHWERRDLEP